MKNKNKYLYIVLLILSLNINNNAFAQTTTIEKPAPILGGVIKWGALAGGIGLGIAGHKLHRYNSVIDLLDNREQVLRLIQGNPGYKNDVLKRLSNTLNKDSKLYSLEQHQQILDLYIQVNNSTEILIPEQINNSTETIEDNDNKQENITSYPQEDLALPNYIYTPYGSKIDTSTEFPNDIIHNWQDYLVFKQDSQELKEDYVKERKREDNNEKIEVSIFSPNVALHHLISATSPDTQEARDILEKYLGPITPAGQKTYNNAINGVPLPKGMKK